jgi:ribosomal RNA-processing protein 8
MLLSTRLREIQNIMEGISIFLPLLFRAICDLGCGEGKLHEHFTKEGNKKFEEVRSFDLAKNKPFVEICDITKLPLKSEYANVCVFSLALMNTNYLDSLLEAHRILKLGGHLVIAEVSSRIPNLIFFVQLIKALGFKFKKYVYILFLLKFLRLKRTHIS